MVQGYDLGNYLAGAVTIVLGLIVSFLEDVDDVIHTFSINEAKPMNEKEWSNDYHFSETTFKVMNKKFSKQVFYIE